METANYQNTSECSSAICVTAKKYKNYPLIPSQRVIQQSKIICIKVGSLNPASHLVGYEPGNLQL